MKILKIELENLNSLRGKWSINLSDSIYEANGIFAITGPTGSGKTTVFDAICLALYGRTPRLKTINKRQNEIMSRKTKTCYARVLFEAGGKKYFSYWEQHCSGKNNALQDATHRLSYADSGGIIAESVKETPKKIAELTGLDFDRFRQAVMLEQGGFDAFLKANKNDRAEILELLTGTKIYSEISKKVYERTQREKFNLENIKFQIQEKFKQQGDSQNPEDILDALNETKKNLEQSKIEQDEAMRSREWLRAIQKLEKNLEDNSREISQLEKRFELFTKNSRRLEAGQRASELAGDFEKLKAERENYKRLQANVEKLKSEISNELAIISEIENENLPEFNRELQEMKKNFSPEESPESFCAFAKERVKIFEEIANRKNEIERRKENYGKIFQQAQRNLNVIEKNKNSAQSNYDEAGKKVFEISNRRIEAILEAERIKLKPGKPCPVCGATEHPYDKLGVKGENLGVQNFDDNSLILLRRQFENARKEFDALNDQYRIAQANESKARANFNNSTQEFDQILGQHAEAKEEISELLSKFEIKVKFVHEIIPKIDDWLAKIKNLEEKFKRLNEKKDSCKVRAETKQNSLDQNNSELEASGRELETLEKNFAAKLHEKNFDDEKIFTDSMIEPDEMKKLNFQKQELESEKIRLHGLKDDYGKKLSAEKSKSITQKNLDELEPEIKAREKLISDLNKKTATLENNLENCKKIKRELAKLKKDCEHQLEIYSDWSELNHLIGSAQGDKFRVFAQNLTLAMMIKLANEQLEKMNGRYVLVSRPDSTELELSVIDKEQAGEIRPTENLSGGERFIISLALALGLSQISVNDSKKSGIDSLFLDEGFGSLDEDALNTALEALAELHRSGRMIGIISHVTALRERIAAQIEIIPKSEGVSIIRGPGVNTSRS